MIVQDELRFLRRWKEIAVKYGMLRCGHPFSQLDIFGDHGSGCVECIRDMPREDVEENREHYDKRRALPPWAR